MVEASIHPLHAFRLHELPDEQAVKQVPQGNDLSIKINVLLVSVECTLELEYDSNNRAELILDSIVQDNGEFVQANVQGNKLVLVSRAESERTLLNTLEDLLSCVRLAEEMAGLR